MNGDVVNFQLDGQEFMALHGGPHFTFAQGMSLFVHCESQQEVDECWEKLSAGLKRALWLAEGCVWGIMANYSIRVRPNAARRRQAAIEARSGGMLKMTKIDLAVLEQACQA